MGIGKDVGLRPGGPGLGGMGVALLRAHYSHIDRFSFPGLSVQRRP